MALVLAAALCVSLAACAVPQTSADKLETLEHDRGGQRGRHRDKDPADYETDIQGLCKFFEESGLTAGEKVQMSYDVIGAVNGYKYAYSYNDSACRSSYMSSRPRIFRKRRRP